MKKYLPFFLMLLFFIDAVAQQSLEYKFFGDKNDLPRSLAVLPNKKVLIILGQKFSKDEPKTSCAVIKTDLSGNLLQQQFFGKEHERLEFVDNFTAARILMAGYSDEYPKGKLWLRIADTNLNVLKDTIFQDIPVQSLYPPKFVMTKNGRLIVVLNGAANSITIIAMTTGLKVEWKKELTNELCEEKKLFCIQFNDFILDDKGNIVITGLFMRDYKKQNYDLFITKLSPDGRLVFRKTVGDGAGQYTPHAIIQANHAYFVTCSERLNPGPIALFLDGSANDDEPSAIYKLDKNRFIIIGRSNETYGTNCWKVYIKEIK